MELSLINPLFVVIVVVVIAAVVVVVVVVVFIVVIVCCCRCCCLLLLLLLLLLLFLLLFLLHWLIFSQWKWTFFFKKWLSVGCRHPIEGKFFKMLEFGGLIMLTLRIGPFWVNEKEISIFDFFFVKKWSSLGCRHRSGRKEIFQKVGI